MRKEIRSTSHSRDTLVMGLNKDGEIIQFNKECQKMTGYDRGEVLKRKMCDVLIPEQYIRQWEETFELAKSKGIDNFKLPWKTRDGKEILISWSSFPLETNEGLVRSICFMGKNLGMNVYKKTSFKKPEENINKEIKPQESEEWMERTNNKSKDMIMFKHDNKRIISEKMISAESDKSFYCTEDVIFPEVEKPVINNFTEPHKMSETLKDLSNKYEKLNRKLGYLEKKDRTLERKNKFLEKSKKPNHETPTSEEMMDKASSKKWPVFLRDFFGVKKKQEEFEHKIHKLDDRKKELGKLEVKLKNDRKNLDEKIAEFSRWKEKLITLESEIEKRRNDLVEPEKASRENSIFSPTTNIQLDGSSLLKKDDSAIGENIDRKDQHKILDKIPQCAAIVQRGILKQINSSFAELIGFETDEIVDKSFFDFIALEGLTYIERYYLNRLQGSDNSTYKTIFSTKNNRKIPVEISIKPTIYDGEKAEIAVVNEVKN